MRHEKLLTRTGLILLAATPFAATIRFGFVFDDTHLIVNNWFIRDWGSPVRSFAHNFWYGGSFMPLYYRPLVVMSLALNGRLLGWGPAGFHLVNVLLHAANTLLLHSLARRLGFTRTAAVIAAAIFAVHPAAAWPVASIVARVDVLAATFVLLAWRSFASPAHSVAVRVAGVSIWFFAALLCKESAVAFLAVPVLAFRLPSVRPAEPSSARLAAWSLAGMLVALGTAVALRIAVGVPLTPGPDGVDPIVNPLFWLPQPVRLWAAVEIAGRYLWYLLFPLRFADPHLYAPGSPAPGIPDAGTVGGAVLIVAWAVGCGVLWFRRDRLSSYLGFALAGFLPASNLLVLISSLYAQNFLYLPLVGSALALGEVARRALPLAGRRWPGLRPRLAAGCVLGVAVAGLGVGSFREARIWRDPESLFDAWTSRFPNFPMAYDALGYYRATVGDLRGAAAAFQRVSELNDRFEGAYYDRGVVLAQAARGPEDLEQALAAFRSALDLVPDYVEAHAQVSGVLRRLGRAAEAEESARQALRLVPGFPLARRALAEALVDQGRFTEAAQEYRNLVALQPTDPDVRGAFVASLIEAGLLDEARIEATQGRGDFPDRAWFEFCLARIQMRAGDPTGAITHLAAALDRDRATLDWITQLDEFDGLRGDERFRALVGTADPPPAR